MLPLLQLLLLEIAAKHHLALPVDAIGEVLAGRTDHAANSPPPRIDNKKTQPKTGLLLNGAKETRTPDPLHTMKILAKLRSVATISSNPCSTSAFGGTPPHLRQLAMARKGRNQT